MSRRDVAIEIIVPGQDGLEKRLGESMINPTASPNLNNANYYYGAIQKEYGTTLFSTGSAGVSNTLATPCNFMFTADFADDSVFELFTVTGIHKYSSALDAFVVDGQTYSGTFTDGWSAALHNDSLIYSNGIQLIQEKTGPTTTGDVMAGVATDSYKAVSVVSFAQHLNLYHVTAAGNTSRKRVRWTKSGLLDGSQTDWNSGTAGFLDVQDVDGDIMTAAKLGNNAVAIYGENSIHIQSWVGGGSVYRFSKMVNNKGTPSRRGVVANGVVHYMLGRDNIYEYSGGTTVKPIGDPIVPEFTTVINQDAMRYAFLDYNKTDRELHVHVPTGTSTQPDTVYTCKVAENYHWYKRDDNNTCAGEFKRTSALTIQELVGNIGAQNWTFGDQVVNAGGITYLAGDQSGRVVKHDKTVYSISDSGTSTPQTFVFDTKDISSVRDVDPLTKKAFEATRYMDNQSRWLKVKVEAKGDGSMYLHYSTDAGQNFTAADGSPVSLNATWDMYQFDLDVAKENLMLRLSNSATNEVVHARYIKAQFVPGGEV